MNFLKSILATIVLFFLLGLNLLVKAQSYTVSPSPEITKSFNCNASTEVEIDFQNQLSSKLSLTWDVINLGIPRCWDYSLCDYGICFTPGNVPSSRTMDSIPVGGHGYLKLTIIVQDTGGTGALKFFVHQAGSTTGDTIVMNVNGCTAKLCAGSTNGIDEQKSNKQIVVVSPNPANDFIHITSDQILVNPQYKVYNIIGEKVLSGMLNGSDISLKTIPSGIYFLTVNTPSQNSTIKIVKQ